MPITPTNWLPFVTQADTSIRQAWTKIPIEYPKYTTEVTMGKGSIWEDGWMGRMPKMRLWSGPRVYNEPAPQTYQAVPQPFELSYALDQFAFDDDEFGVFYPMLLDYAEQTKQWPEYQMRDFVEASGAWASTQTQKGLDGLSFFNVAHQTNIYSLTTGTINAGTAYANDFTGGGVTVNGITVGGAFGAVPLMTMIEYMQTYRAEDGERLRITPSHLMIPPSLWAEANYVLKNQLAAQSVGYTTWGAAQTQVGATDNVVARMGVEPFVNKNLASFTKYYLMDLTKSVKPMRWILRKPVSFRPLVSPTDPLVVDQHLFTWVGDGRGCPAWSPSWLMARGGP